MYSAHYSYNFTFDHLPRFINVKILHKNPSHSCPIYIRVTFALLVEHVEHFGQTLLFDMYN